MDRSRSKRPYHHYDAPPDSYRRTHRRRTSPSGPPSPPANPPPANSTTYFRIICPHRLAGTALPATVLASVRQETGAWVTALPRHPDDDVVSFEAADSARRESDGRPPIFSPAQDAITILHRRIVEAVLADEDAFDDGGVDDDEGGRGRGRGGRSGRVTTRLIVPKPHVGCLLGKGGKVIEHMKQETRTHIRILPRDGRLPRCVSSVEEVVQIVGDVECVKRALAIVLDRLKESLHRDRDRAPFRGRYSPERRTSPDPEFHSVAHHLPPLDRSADTEIIRNNSYTAEPSGYVFDSNGIKMNVNAQIYEDIVFRILCPVNKVDNFVGGSKIIQVLQAEVGVDVRICDLVSGSEERIVVITSNEGPDDLLFPAQEALLHIQNHIVDLGPDKDNIITTRLLIKASEISCLEGKDGSLSDIQRSTGANVQILPKEELPPCASQSDELIQIVGEIRRARSALLEITEKLRSYQFRDISGPNNLPQISYTTFKPTSNFLSHEPNSALRGYPNEVARGSDRPLPIYEHMQSGGVSWHPKDAGGVPVEPLEQGVGTNSITEEARQSTLKRIAVPLVTRTILEVVIPKSAVPSLTARSGSKLVQISEMSGATITLLEEKLDIPERFVQISGTPEQADKAQSLLQGFILFQDASG